VVGVEFREVDGLVEVMEGLLVFGEIDGGKFD
jgi:hypothetical protein